MRPDVDTSTLLYNRKASLMNLQGLVRNRRYIYRPDLHDLTNFTVFCNTYSLAPYNLGLNLWVYGT